MGQAGASAPTQRGWHTGLYRIAPSKTLAKLASEHAKTDPGLSGVLDLRYLPDETRDAYLLRTPIKRHLGYRLAAGTKTQSRGPL